MQATLTRTEKRGLRGSQGLAFGTNQWSVSGLRTKLRRRRSFMATLVLLTSVAGISLAYVYGAESLTWVASIWR